MIVNIVFLTGGNIIGIKHGFYAFSLCILEFLVDFHGFAYLVTGRIF